MENRLNLKIANIIIFISDIVVYINDVKQFVIIAQLIKIIKETKILIR